MKPEYDCPGYVKVMLFECLLPKMLYSGEGREGLFNILRYNGRELVGDLLGMMCHGDGDRSSANAVQVYELNRGGVNILRIDLPRARDDVDDILRAYLLFPGNGRDVIDKRLFVIKRFRGGRVFNLYIDHQLGGQLGGELTDKAEDAEYEYWKIVTDYTIITVNELTDIEQEEHNGRGEARTWSRDWDSFNWEGIIEKLKTLDSEGVKTDNDVGISRDDFIEYLYWMKENFPQEFERLRLYDALRDAGADNDKALYYLTHMDELLRKLWEYVYKKNDPKKTKGWYGIYFYKK